MAIAPLTIRSDFWQTLTIEPEDLEFLYNQLLETELPQTSAELIKLLINEKIKGEKDRLKNQQVGSGKIFQPKDSFTAGDKLVFPALDWKKGVVKSVRPGNNPEIGEFSVICVDLEDGTEKEFAASLPDHILNEPVKFDETDPNFSNIDVFKKYGKELTARLTKVLENQPDLVNIAGRWFPRALLVDVNVGHLNLAEAVLEEDNGGPMLTAEIIKQIELPTDVNPRLTEFSLNLSLQEDERFDEVGPAGETLWFLHRLEPEFVKNPPPVLRYSAPEFDRAAVEPLLQEMSNQICDELEPACQEDEEVEEVTISLIYPHWRAGTLPISPRVKSLFPTAYEAPRVIFTFIDSESSEKFSGWVVRPFSYAFGLKDWYTAQGLIPGSMIRVIKGKNPGEVIVHAEKRKQGREWLRTVLVGADGGIVFATLKQPVSAAFDERMAIAIPDPEAVDRIWEQPASKRGTLDTTVAMMLRELAKLNPQGHVHAQELYSAVNLVRRCPPAPLLYSAAMCKKATYLGDLYFRYSEETQEQ